MLVVLTEQYIIRVSQGFLTKNALNHLEYYRFGIVLDKIHIIIAVIVLAILLVSLGSFVLNQNSDDPKAFYVGVTYCGSSTEEAKLLIDRVKNYTNIFFLQSGPLQQEPDIITEIGDYAISSGLYFVVYFGTDSSWLMKTWLDTYDGQWNDKFLGVYFGDEPGGKMLDGEMAFYDQESQSTLRKMADGSVSCKDANGNNSTSITYHSDGRIVLEITEISGEPLTNEGNLNTDYVNKNTRISYYPNVTVVAEVRDDSNDDINEQNEVVTFSNETVTFHISNDTNTYEVIENYNITFTYEQLWNVRPFQTYDEMAERFVNECNFAFSRYGPKDFMYFTSDYALYWFDYKAGFDVVLAQLGWNHTLVQDIALVRGAANLQNKQWGAIITWKYNHPPYLDTGEAIYKQICSVYEAGGQYAVVFNYAENMTGPYGTLQEEHFDALERFWNEVVQNPEIKQRSIEAEAALVLPENYGWGMRWPNDKIWGIWRPDEKSEQIWNLLEQLIQEYGPNLDIIYEDPKYPAEEKYEKTFYWN